jgi:hypothetical protein
VWTTSAFADPPPPDPGDAVAPGAPPLAPLPPPASTPPATAPAPQWGTTLPLVQLDPYPEAYVDRPITLLPGMTELSAAYEFSSYVQETLGHRTPDLSVRHSFGPVELTADLGEYAVLSAAIPTGSFPAVIVIGADSGVPQRDDSLHVGQFAELEHKVHLSPKQCALFFDLGAGYNENRIVNTSQVLEWTHAVIASLDATLELQLLPTVNLALGVGYSVPVTSSEDVHLISSLNAGATLTATFAHSWDIYANGGATNLVDYRLPFLSFGFAKRWGE